jgi:hypothetical protein
MTRTIEGFRRRAPRLKTRLGGSLVGRAAREVEVLDLSLRGCLVRSPATFDHGAILDLHLGIGGDPVVAKVRVSSASLDGSALGGDDPRYLLGLEFIRLAAQGQARLQRFLDEERRRAAPSRAGA